MRCAGQTNASTPSPRRGCKAWSISPSAGAQRTSSTRKPGAPEVREPLRPRRKARGVAFETGEAELGRRLRGRAVVHLVKADAFGEQALAVAEDLVHGLHEKREQRQHLAITRLRRLRLVPARLQIAPDACQH